MNDQFALDHYSLAELTQLISAAQRRLKELVKRPHGAKVRQELTQLAPTTVIRSNNCWTTPTPEKAATKRRKRKPGKVAPKYRDPDNPRNTWSGRGSQPRWLAEEVKRGRHAADFLIPGLAKPTAKKPVGDGQRTVFKAAAG